MLICPVVTAVASLLEYTTTSLHRLASLAIVPQAGTAAGCSICLTMQPAPWFVSLERTTSDQLRVSNRSVHSRQQSPGTWSLGGVLLDIAAAAHQARGTCPEAADCLTCRTCRECGTSTVCGTSRECDLLAVAPLDAPHVTPDLILTGHIMSRAGVGGGQSGCCRSSWPRGTARCALRPRALNQALQRGRQKVLTKQQRRFCC
jgi:hypothetical protein